MNSNTDTLDDVCNLLRDIRNDVRAIRIAVEAGTDDAPTVDDIASAVWDSKPRPQ